MRIRDVNNVPKLFNVFNMMVLRIGEFRLDERMLNRAKMIWFEVAR